MPEEIDKNQIKILRDKLEVFKSRGYFLNPDKSFTDDLIKSLLINEARYGYQACPCRLASGVKAEDLDIICPCDYRDADVSEYGACYCGLYVSENIYESRSAIKPIPERRPNKELRSNLKNMEKENKPAPGNLSYPVWRCQVCGYICARGEAPDTCPICGAGKERFEKFM